MASPAIVELPNMTIGQNYEFIPAQGNIESRLNFSVAARNGKDAQGEVTQWYRCTIWGKFAESLHDSIGSYGKLDKGRSVFVRGQLTLSLYFPRDGGDPRINADVKVTEIQVANWPKDNDGSDDGNGNGATTRQQRPSSSRPSSRPSNRPSNRDF